MEADRRDLPQGRSQGEFQRYCSSVCVLIRWKPARQAVARELTGHLNDHADALAGQGMDWDRAASQAVKAMGNPYALGLALDRLHSPFWHRVALGIALLALALAVWLAILLRVDQGELIPHRADLPLWGDEEAALLEGDWRQVTAVAARGIAEGGGRLGDYTLTPGAAAVVRLEDGETGETAYELRVAYTASHNPLRTGPLDLRAARITASDSLGGTYPQEGRSLGWEDTYASRPWADGYCFTLDDPALGAEEFTLCVDAPSGARVYVTVSLEWEGEYGAD